MIVYCIVRKRTREKYETEWSFGEARQWHTRLETMCVCVCVCVILYGVGGGGAAGDTAPY